MLVWPKIKIKLSVYQYMYFFDLQASVEIVDVERNVAEAVLSQFHVDSREDSSQNVVVVTQTADKFIQSYKSSDGE